MGWGAAGHIARIAVSFQEERLGGDLLPATVETLLPPAAQARPTSSWSCRRRCCDRS